MTVVDPYMLSAIPSTHCRLNIEVFLPTDDAPVSALKVLVLMTMAREANMEAMHPSHKTDAQEWAALDEFVQVIVPMHFWESECGASAENAAAAQSILEALKAFAEAHSVSVL